MTKTIFIILFCVSFFAYSQNNSIELLSRYENWGSDMNDRTFYYIQYGKHSKNFDAFIRPTIMFRGGDVGLITDIDYYPKFKRGYGYFNLGYSNSEQFFPRIRSGAEIYRTLTKKTEASLGVRYININFPTTYNIFSLTGTFGYYFGDYFVYGRPTMSFLEDGIGWNGMGVVRRYFDNKNYLEFTAAKGVDTGISRNVNSIENNFGLQGYILRLKGHYNVNETLSLALGYDFSGIFIPSKDEYVQINSFDILIKKKF